MEKINLSPAEITFEQFLSLSLPERLRLTADYVQEFVEKGGIVNWWDRSDDNIFCPAQIVLLKLEDTNWSEVNVISDVVYNGPFSLHDSFTGCIGKPENIRQLADMLETGAFEYEY